MPACFRTVSQNFAQQRQVLCAGMNCAFFVVTLCLAILSGLNYGSFQPLVLLFMVLTYVSSLILLFAKDESKFL